MNVPTFHCHGILDRGETCIFWQIFTSWGASGSRLLLFFYNTIVFFLKVFSTALLALSYKVEYLADVFWNDICSQIWLRSVIFQPVCYKWSAGVSWEFVGESFIRRAIGGYEPPTSSTTCLVNCQKWRCTLTILVPCKCAMQCQRLKILSICYWKNCPKFFRRLPRLDSDVLQPRNGFFSYM